MANQVNLKELTPKMKKKLVFDFRRFKERIQSPAPEFLEKIPLLGRIVKRYNFGEMLEAMFFFVQSEDPVVDQKMINAIRIRDYEMKFGLYTSAAWGLAFSLLPALKGYNITTRLFWGLVPFSLSYYRAFRRGYDQMSYVGMVYIEILLKRREALKYLNRESGYLSEVKDEIMKRRDYKQLMFIYGIDKNLNPANLKP